MQVAVAVIFIGLCIIAPWVARKWKWGGFVWSITTLSFLVSVVLIVP
jgi:hypothetical protein